MWKNEYILLVIMFALGVVLTPLGVRGIRKSFNEGSEKLQKDRFILGLLSLVEGAALIILAILFYTLDILKLL